MLNHFKTNVSSRLAPISPFAAPAPFLGRDRRRGGLPHTKTFSAVYVIYALFVMDGSLGRPPALPPDLRASPFGVAAPRSWPPDPGIAVPPPLAPRAVALGALTIAQQAIDLLRAVIASPTQRYAATISLDALVPPPRPTSSPCTPASPIAPTPPPSPRPKPSATPSLANTPSARPSSTSPRMPFALAGPPPFEPFQTVRRRRATTTPRQWPASLSLHDASIFCDCEDLYEKRYSAAEDASHAVAWDDARVWCDLFVWDLGRYLPTKDMHAMACSARWHAWCWAGRASSPPLEPTMLAPALGAGTGVAKSDHPDETQWRRSEDKRQDFDHELDRAAHLEDTAASSTSIVPPKRSRTTDTGSPRGATKATAIIDLSDRGARPSRRPNASVSVHVQRALAEAHDPPLDYAHAKKLRKRAAAVAGSACPTTPCGNVAAANLIETERKP